MNYQTREWPQCEETTNKGRRCKNPIITEQSKYCGRHRSKRMEIEKKKQERIQRAKNIMFWKKQEIKDTIDKVSGYNTHGYEGRQRFSSIEIPGQQQRFKPKILQLPFTPKIN